MLNKRQARFGLNPGGQRRIYNARYAEAFASLSKGQVFFGVLNYNGQYGGQGAYQNVKEEDSPEDNDWIRYELPTWQHKSQATNITTFAVSDNSYYVDWIRGVKGEVRPHKNSMKLAVPPMTKKNDESSACTLDDNPNDYEYYGRWCSQ